MTLSESIRHSADYARLAAKRLGQKFNTLVKPEATERSRFMAQATLTRIAHHVVTIADRLATNEEIPFSFPPSAHTPHDASEGTVIAIGEDLHLAYDPYSLYLKLADETNPTGREDVLGISFYRDPGQEVVITTNNIKEGSQSYIIPAEPQQYGDSNTINRGIIRTILDSVATIHTAIDESSAEKPTEQSTTDSRLLPVLPDFTELFPFPPPYQSPSITEDGAHLTHSENQQQGLEIIDHISLESDHPTYLQRVVPHELPYAQTDPLLAEFVARNSVWVGSDGKRALLSSEPESGVLMLQVLSSHNDRLPTLFFQDPTLGLQQPGFSEPTIQVGFSPFCNPYDVAHTTLYPIPAGGIMGVTRVAQSLLQRLLAEAEYDFPLQWEAINGMPYIGDHPEYLFGDYAKRVLRAAVPTKEAMDIHASFSTNSHHPHAFGIGVYRPGRNVEALISLDPKTHTTSLTFEVATGKDVTSHRTNTTISLDSDGFRLDGELITPDVLIANTELFPTLARIRRYMQHIQDGWNMMEMQGNVFITDDAREEIPDLLLYLFGLINPDGTLNRRMPYMAPYQGRVSGDFVATERIMVKPPEGSPAEVFLDPTRITPIELDFEGLPSNTLFGYESLTSHDTATYPTIPADNLEEGALRAGDLIDLEQLAEVPLFQTGIPAEEPALPSSPPESEKDATESSSAIPDVFQGWETVGEVSQTDDALPDFTTRPLAAVDNEEHVPSSDTKPTTPTARRQRRRSAQAQQT